MTLTANWHTRTDTTLHTLYIHLLLAQGSLCGPGPLFFRVHESCFCKFGTIRGEWIGPMQGLYLHRTAQNRRNAGRCRDSFRTHSSNDPEAEAVNASGQPPL